MGNSRLVLNYVAVIFLSILCVELALEYRAHDRGFSTLLFDRSDAESDVLNQSDFEPEFGPYLEYPFRSRIVPVERRDIPRYWIASSSYSEAAYTPVEKIFANSICPDFQCEVLNASKAGYTIESNTEDLNKLADKWKPDFALLYQMGNDIEDIISLNETVDARHPVGLFDDISEKVNKKIQSTTIFSHLRNYIGGTVLVNSIRRSELTLDQQSSFKNRIVDFVLTARKHEIEPILVTFKAAYRVEMIHQMPIDLKLQLLRYGGNLSVEGWLDQMEKLNHILREVSEEYDVVLFDLEKEADLTNIDFKDNFHFNLSGHSKVATYFRKKLSHIQGGELHGI